MVTIGKFWDREISGVYEQHHVILENLWVGQDIIAKTYVQKITC